MIEEIKKTTEIQMITQRQIFKRELDLVVDVYRMQGWQINIQWAWFRRLRITGQRGDEIITIETTRKDAAYSINAAFSQVTQIV